jgi:type I restriction-modification system DNA methylase subunit
MGSSQINLFPVLDQGLFSTNFLDTKFLNFSIWQNTPGLLDRTTQTQRAVLAAYESAKRAGVFEAHDEQKTEDKFIRPVLKALGWVYDPQPRHKRGKVKVRPDYALFATQQDYENAARSPNDPKAYYSQAQAISEAKYWGRPLNDTVKDDPLDARDATAQLVRYLDEVYYHTDGKVSWGILTNGKTWRLFSHRAASRSSNYYELDLESLLHLNDPLAFRRFYGFFALEALTPDPLTGKRWVDLYLEESDRAARAVSHHLKKLIFDQVFKRVADGFVTYRRAEKNIAQETDESLQEVFAGTITLLFRLLFLLYAESRDLLPVHDQLGYRKKSLQALKERVHDDLRIGAKQSSQSFDYWEHLYRLFRIVDRGDAALSVPHYNGGLFHARKKLSKIQRAEEIGTRFLADHKLADAFVADAIHGLTFDHDTDLTERRFIDYSALGVRHLGDVYEGLLEFRLKQESPSEPLKLESTSRERKESGSYFTPHFIVEFIVAKSVGPVVDLHLRDVEVMLTEWQKACEQRKRVQTTQAIKSTQQQVEQFARRIFTTIFGIKVLDPTMGSGHFLVHTVNYLADRIVAFLAAHPGNPVITAIERMRQTIVTDLRAQKLDDREITRIVGKLTEINLIKRMVMKRCVYGVDLNPMAVELAKLSLWLDSFTLGAPLSFLDHHLKCGNTLVGAEVERVEQALEGGLFGTQFSGMLQATELMREVGELTDATVAEVEESETKFDHAREALSPFIQLMNVWQAEPFGHPNARKALRHLGGQVGVIDHKTKPAKTKALEEAVGVTAAINGFFHWELEFPEAWYGGGRRLDEPGFDAVIGNPPWVRQETIAKLKKVLSVSYPNFYEGAADIYVYVLACGLNVLKPGGRLGFILPNKWLRANYGEKLRETLTKEYCPELLVDFGHAPIFPAADTFPVVAIIRRPHPADSSEASTLRVCPVPRGELDEIKLAPFVEKHAFGVPTVLLKREGWTLEPPEILRLFEKIKNSGQPLKEFVGDVPYRGVLTGLNEAFFIDQSTRERLITEDPKCERLIKKLLRGRNIQRWTAEWEKEWILVLRSSHNETWPWTQFEGKSVKAEESFKKEFPSLHAHLKPMEQALRKREDQGKFWWELRACDYYDKFEEPKIIYQDIQFHSWFALDLENCYLNDTGHVIPTGDLSVLSILNSTLIWWFNWRYLPHGKDDALRLKTYVFESIPLTKPDSTQKSTIELRVSRLIELAKSFNQKRASFLQWVSHETGIMKIPTSLESPWKLRPEEFLLVLKKAGLKYPSPATLQHLTRTFGTESAGLRTNRIEALQLERRLDELILKIYKLTPDEITLLHQTAPPRSPLRVLAENLTGLHTPTPQKL